MTVISSARNLKVAAAPATLKRDGERLPNWLTVEPNLAPAFSAAAHGRGARTVAMSIDHELNGPNMPQGLHVDQVRYIAPIANTARAQRDALLSNVGGG